MSLAARLGKSGAVLIGAVLTGLCGWWLGSVYGDRQVEQMRLKSLEDWRSTLATNVAGISIGAEFPSFPVWPTDGSNTPTDVLELFPIGGFLVAVSPTCEVCVDVAKAFQEAVGRAARSCPTVLMLEGEAASSLVDGLRRRGISLPIYMDVEMSLRTKHGVVHNPTFYAIDQFGVLRHAGFGVMPVPDLVGMIETYCDGDEELGVNERR